MRNIFIKMTSVILTLVICSMSSCSAQQTNTASSTSTELENQVKRLVFDYAVDRGETVEYKTFDFTPLYGDANPMYKYSDCMSAELFAEQERYIKERWSSAIHETVDPGDVSVIETVGNEYTLELTDKCTVLYPNAKNAVEERRTWRYTVTADENGLTICDIRMPCLTATSQDGEIPPHSSVEEIIECRVAFYLLQRTEATGLCGKYGFEALLPYLSEQSGIIQREREYFERQCAQNVIRSSVSHNLKSSVEKLDDNGNYRVHITEIQDISQNDESTSIETYFFWVIDVNASTDGIIITDINSDPEKTDTLPVEGVCFLSRIVNLFLKTS